ncbi:ferredoxin--NADP reductase [Draconibacterium halophilum]|uniref:FAD-dependent oxidoreductase n=1 Tax=Draconibacterium halophilum TaxID=2706887 RepID=A0A6C0R7Z2_9BACT|nr:FAD-dependent oxidoreductase [Draconibacterium halophilum]QIA06310.1 FAD-dependent oxidoreductase [Draconibacterium halophilum]
MSARTKKEPALIEQVVTNNEEISPGVHVISFRRDSDFLPGQVVKIGVDTENPPRIYSICSGNQEDEIRILFNIKDDGFLTPKMAGMIPGDILYVSEPYGSFLGTNEPAWWIASGTGIAPFYAMYRSGMSENKTLIHGVRYLNQFYFEDELEWSMGKNYVRCCSQEQSCDVFPGRVTSYLEGLTELPDVKYYLCGKALMVVEVRDMLIERGVDYGNIIAEIYF